MNKKQLYKAQNMIEFFENNLIKAGRTPEKATKEAKEGLAKLMKEHPAWIKNC